MSTRAEHPAGILYIVATPIGNRDDLSRRAEKVLREVDTILCEDTRHSGRLLNELGIDTPRQALHEHNEAARSEGILERLRRGESLALVSDAGTPLINDPGFVLVRAAREAGLRVVPVPGASAIITALSAAGLPTDRFAYEGFLPPKQAARRERLRALAGETRTLVFYEAPHRLQAMLEDAGLVFGAGRHACVAREMTKQFEQFRNGTLEGLAAWSREDANATRGELVVVIEGASEHGSEQVAHDALLRALLEELPASKAARLAARITGEKRQSLYQRALELADEA